MTKKLKKTLIPAGHRLLIKPDEVPSETVTDVGIVIPHTDPKRVRFGVSTGTIVAVGPDAWLAFRKMHPAGHEVNGQPWAKVGDKVHFPPAAGRFVENDQTKEVFKVMLDEDILLVERVEEAEA